MFQIMQGDAFDVPIRISLQGSKVTPDMVKSVEVMIDHLCKVYPKEIRYDEDKEVWLFPITQQETFALSPNRQPVQVRVKFSDDTVIGVTNLCLKVDISESKVVL